MRRTHLYITLRQVFIPYLSFFISISLWGQRFSLSYDTCRVFKSFSLSRDIDGEILSFEDNENIQLLYYNAKGKPVIEKYKESEPLKHTLYNVDTKKDKMVAERKVYRFTTVNDLLAISTYTGISLYQKKGKAFKLTKIFSCKAPDYINIREESIITGYCGNYSPKSHKYKLYLRKLNLNGIVTDSIAFHVHYPELLTYTPANYITFGKDYIYAAQPSPFRIYRISYDLKLVDSIDLTH